MLRSVKSILGLRMGAKDGEIGKVDSLLFDEISWVIRYIVVNTGSWLPGRKVLLSPIALGQPNWQAKIIPVELTTEQIKESPDIDTDKPISEQCEIELHKHYNWTPYWGVGAFAAAPPAPTQEEKTVAAVEAKDKVDHTLRSTAEVTGYSIQASDGDIGHIEDFIVNDENWTIPYLVIDTRNWLPGRSVLISPQWVERISWPQSKVWVDLRKDTIKDSPAYDPSAPVNREYEARLYDYYGRPKYWA